MSNEKTEKRLKQDDLWTKMKETEVNPAQGRLREEWIIVFKYASNSYIVNADYLTAIDISIVVPCFSIKIYYK